MKTARITGLERIELERLRDRVGRLYAALQEAAITDDATSPGAWSPPVDVCEAGDAVTVRVELPGVSAADVTLALTSAQLKISGEKRRSPSRRRVAQHLCSERRYGPFSRVVPLSRWTIDVRGARAELIDGVLLVRLPKRAERRGSEYKVPIEEGRGR